MKKQREGDRLVIACPCGRWVLVIPMSELKHTSPTLLRDEVDLKLKEHMQECIILTASHITALAAQDG